MAGAYPNAPSNRMAWDDDGTVMLYAFGAAQTGTAGTPPNTTYIELSVAQKEDMNDEDNTSFFAAGIVGTSSSRVTSLYAQKREIDGAYYVFDANTSEVRWVAGSVDSTNGRDGTFTDYTISGFGPPVATDGYRDDIETKAESNVVSIMFYGAGNLRNNYYFVHTYGNITPGETPDRLLFLDPDNADAEFTLPLDFGDVPRGQTQQDTFKVRNNSGSLSANTVQVIVESLSDGSGPWYTLSDDDIVYTGTLSLGNISAGGTSLVHLRQIVPDAQVPGAYAARVQVGQASWT